MEDILGKIISYLLMVFALFIAIMSLLTGVDRTMDIYITNKATSFVDVCCTTGRVEPENYEAFCQSIYKIGNYDIELCHGKRLALWSDEDGEASVSYKETYTEEILAKMYESDEDVNKAYVLSNGDYIKITIRKESKGLSGGLYQFFLNRDSKSNLLVNYSGIVGSNGIVTP